MNSVWFVAKRYFKPKSGFQAIHWISRIASWSIAAGTMGLIIVLSVFNGFQDLVSSLYNSFQPDLQIESRTGKNFESALIPLSKVKALNIVEYTCPSIEENVLLKFQDRQFIATLKGVEPSFSKVSGIDSTLIEGNFDLGKDPVFKGVFGIVIADGLGISSQDYFHPIDIYIPRKGVELSLNPTENFNRSSFLCSSVFAIQQDFDSKYVLTNIKLLQELTEDSTHWSTLEMKLKPGIDLEQAQAQVQALLPNNLKVKTRFQLEETLYRIMTSEKWAVFFILSLIIFIASFSIVGFLGMLMLDKSKDIGILRALGLNNRQIIQVYWLQGIYTTIKGMFFGLIIGLVICYAQQRFQLINMGGTSFVVDAYPVVIKGVDILSIVICVTAIGSLIACIPAFFLAPRLSKESIR